jgi:amino acid carrier protein
MDVLGLVKAFNEILWNSFLMYALLGVGIFYTIYLGFPQIRHFNLAMKYAFGPAFQRKKDGEEKSKVNSFQALATAVAAQVGTGNVAGVATAISMGGVGSVFWMWVSAILGMGTIFSEAVLAQKYREVRPGGAIGGPAFYIREGLGSRWLALFFSIAFITYIGFTGSMVQANSITVALTTAFPIEPWVIGVGIALVVGIVIIGGQRRITSVAELVVPFMAIAYILGSLIIMVLYYDAIPHVFGEIFSEAFSTKAAAGGAAGMAIKYAIRYGVARGLFSNEAGMGTSPHAHAMAEVKDPAMQGFVAMSGVFITLLICTSTALVILLTGVHTRSGLESTAITQEAFDMVFGKVGIIFLQVSIFFFAFTTIIGNYIFGEMNVRSLFGKVGVYVFRAIVVGSVFVGAIFAVTFVWEITDTVTGLMTIPNIIALILLAPQVKDAYKKFHKRRSEGELD